MLNGYGGLREVDFGGHRNRFAAAAGGGLSLAVCGSDGTPIWPGDDADALLADAWARVKAGGFAWDCNGSGYRHHVLDGGHAIVHVPIAGAQAAPDGYLVAVGEAALLDVTAPAFGRVAQSLAETAAAIGTEARLRGELDALGAELGDRYEELHLVYSIDACIRDYSGGWEVFQQLVDLCARHMNVDVAAFVYPGMNLTKAAAHLSKPMFNLDLVLVEMRGDLYRFLQAGKESVAINDRDDPRRGYIFTDMPYKVLASPLYLRGSVAAILVLVNHDDKTDFSASDRRLVEVMANQFSNLMQLCQLVDEQSTFSRQIVDALIESVEAKDPYTRGHSDRVRAISTDLARELDLPAADVDSISWGSLLHDVGKIGIPDAVLCKPSSLTRDEYTFIKVHAERGCEILRHINCLQHVIPGIRHHHERFDGKGYPHGIAGRAIPIAGRIIAVADTYDAMTSSRAYRAGRSHEEAAKEISRVSGTQLDPECVAAFLRICERKPAWISTFGTLRGRDDG